MKVKEREVEQDLTKFALAGADRKVIREVRIFCYSKVCRMFSLRDKMRQSSTALQG